jgi:hypothetical protein
MRSAGRRWWSPFNSAKDLLLCVTSPVKDRPERPSQEQVASFQHLLAHQESLLDAVLEAVHTEYPRLRGRLKEFVDEHSMPPGSEPAGLLRLISPNIIHLLANPKDGFTRVGFGFDCKWDEDHGLGVLTHQGRVIKVGGADEAFSEYFPDLEGET